MTSISTFSLSLINAKVKFSGCYLFWMVWGRWTRRERYLRESFIYTEVWNRPAYLSSLSVSAFRGINSFAFNIMIDILALISAILLFVFYVFYVFVVPLFFLYHSLHQVIIFNILFKFLNDFFHYIFFEAFNFYFPSGFFLEGRGCFF